MIKLTGYSTGWITNPYIHEKQYRILLVNTQFGRYQRHEWRDNETKTVNKEEWIHSINYNVEDIERRCIRIPLTEFSDLVLT